MNKILTVLLMLSLLMLLLLACDDEQREINPQQIDDTVIAELVQEEDTKYIGYIEAVPTPAPSPESIQFAETAKIMDVMEIPQDRTNNTPAETPTSTPKPMQQTLAATPKPTQSNDSAQAPNQTSAPTPQSTPEPEEQSMPKPQPTSEPIPEPNPQPTPPPVIIVTPPPARTICNTCEADITGNLIEHGTAHLILRSR